MKVALAALAIALTASGSLAQTPAAWPTIVPADAASPADIERMARDFPHSGSLQRRRAGAAHEAGDAATVRDALTRFAAMGGSFSAAGREGVRAYFDDAQWTELTARMDVNEARIGESRVAHAIPADHPLIEAVATDCGDEVYATSVVGRRLLRLIDGAWTPVALPANTGSLFGVAYDRERARLWIASGALDQTPSPETAFRGLIGYDPATGEAELIAAPEGATPGDVAVAPDGAVYVSDGLSGAIYRRAPEGGDLATFVSPGTLRSPQGIAFSADGAALYVADYNYGIARVDRATGAAVQLLADGPALLDGIDGLVRDENALIAIRNGSNPRAILRLTLSPDGMRIVSVEALERANPEWGEATVGVICGDTLLYNSDAQWERFPTGPEPDPSTPARPTRIRALSLD